MPQLDALFLTTPIAWDGNVTQQSGRLHREFEGKTEVVVYDYVDVSVPMLERMYKKRLQTYGNLGYEVCSPTDEDEGANGGSFIGKGDWLGMFETDIREAEALDFGEGPLCERGSGKEASARAAGCSREGSGGDLRGAEACGERADGFPRYRRCCSARRAGVEATWFEDGPTRLAVIDERCLFCTVLCRCSLPEIRRLPPAPARCETGGSS